MFTTVNTTRTCLCRVVRHQYITATEPLYTAISQQMYTSSSAVADKPVRRAASRLKAKV